MLFINFSSEVAASFKYKYHELAELYKGNNLSFLMADIGVSSHATKVHNSVSFFVCVGFSCLVIPT